MTEQSTQLPDADQRIATRAAEAKARHWQGVADAQRKEIERLQDALADSKASNDLLRDRLQRRGWRRVWDAVRDLTTTK